MVWLSPSHAKWICESHSGILTMVRWPSWNIAKADREWWSHLTLRIISSPESQITAETNSTKMSTTWCHYPHQTTNLPSAKCRNWTKSRCQHGTQTPTLPPTLYSDSQHSMSSRTVIMRGLEIIVESYHFDPANVSTWRWSASFVLRWMGGMTTVSGSCKAIWSCLPRVQNITFLPDLQEIKYYTKIYYNC